MVEIEPGDTTPVDAAEKFALAELQRGVPEREEGRFGINGGMREIKRNLVIFDILGNFG